MDHITEAEQIEIIKKWWKEYGVAAIIGVLVAIAAGFGWHYWQQRHEQMLVHASMRYEQLLTAMVNNEMPAAEARANRLIERYPHTPYAQLAALQLARQDIYTNKVAEADNKLRWLMKHGDSPALRTVARVRLARLLISQNKPQEAIELLDKNDNKTYAAVVDEIKGDAYVLMGNKEQAHQSYENAIKEFPGIEVVQPLIRMKLDDLAVSNSTENK